MDEDRARHISVSDHNEHYFWVEEDFYVRVIGNLSMRLRIKGMDNEEEALIDLDSFEIDTIEEIDIAEST